MVFPDSIGKERAAPAGKKPLPLVTASAARLLSWPCFAVLKPMVYLHSWQRLQSFLGWTSRASLPVPEAPLIPPAQPVGDPVALPVEPAGGFVGPLMAPLETSLMPTLESAKKGGSCSLVVYCLGSFRVYQNEQLIERWNGYKGRSIFKYLISHRERPSHREILMELFWPEADPEFARRNLHQAIFNLRQTLQTGCAHLAHIWFEDGCYYLNPEKVTVFNGREPDASPH